MWYSPGDGKAPKLAATNQFEYDGPKSVNYYIHNDLLIGLFQPLYDSPYYYSGYIDELRFWRPNQGVRVLREPASGALRGVK